MVTREDIHSDLAVPPGDFLGEVLEDLGMTQADLARRMGRPPQAINEIVKGTKALTPETALQLEQVVGVPAHVWLGLEGEYRLVSARQAAEEQVKQETGLLEAFPYKEMVELGCVAAVRKAEDKVRELRRFFGVASLPQLGQVPAYATAFRLGTGARQASAYGLTAWLHCGLIHGRQARVDPFDEAKLRALLPALRGLTTAPAGHIASQVHELLAGSGVAFVLFPHFPKTYAHGATFWIEPRKKAVLLSSNRGRWADIFWFSFFHELGHVLLHGNKDFVELDRGAVRTPEEEEADRFACEVLIPTGEYAAFVGARDFSVTAVNSFAKQVEVHAGIVVGRLQHDGLIGRDRLNGLRMRYVLAADAGESAA